MPPKQNSFPVKVKWDQNVHNPRNKISEIESMLTKCKKYSRASDTSAGVGLFIKLMKIFPQIPGVQGNYLFFQEFSRALEENFKIPGVFQEFQE